MNYAKTSGRQKAASNRKLLLAALAKLNNQYRALSAALVRN
jgi:hypothetical protein